jgi:hypothetical protein
VVAARAEVPDYVKPATIMLLKRVGVLVTMRIKEIEIPDELLDVLNDGKLVVFAGAGVSR